MTAVNFCEVDATGMLTPVQIYYVLDARVYDVF